MTILRNLPGLDIPSNAPGLVVLEKGGDGAFERGRDGVCEIVATGDRKVEFIAFENHTLAFVRSALGYPAYYPVRPAKIRKPIKAVLMDLDGTSVHSEHFWIWIIERTTASLLGNSGFQLEEADIAHVSGHSVSEHLQYCIEKYCPEKNIEEARRHYYEHTHREMREIMEGRGKADAFTPAPGLKEFLLELKARRIKIGLVTSGLYEKAYPEIVAAFRTLGLGDPKDFYDGIITAGFPMRQGESGTMGELELKPHPWLYAEICSVGLNLPFAEREHIVGLEDSGAGVCSVRLAGLPVIGITGGNIVASGTQSLCEHLAEKLEDVLDLL